MLMGFLPWIWSRWGRIAKPHGALWPHCLREAREGVGDKARLAPDQVRVADCPSCTVSASPCSAGSKDAPRCSPGPAPVPDTSWSCSSGGAPGPGSSSLIFFAGCCFMKMTLYSGDLTSRFAWDCPVHTWWTRGIAPMAPLHPESVVGCRINYMATLVRLGGPKVSLLLGGNRIAKLGIVRTAGSSEGLGETVFWNPSVLSLRAKSHAQGARGLVLT